MPKSLKSYLPKPKARLSSREIWLSEKYAAKCAVTADVLRASGHVELKNTSGSMVPSFWPGDNLVIDRVGIDEIVVGDLALYSRNGRLTLHRVIEKNAGWLITQGDSVPFADEPVPAPEVLGRVTAIRRGGSEFAPRRKLTCPQRLLSSLIRRDRRFWSLVVLLNALRLRLRR